MIFKDALTKALTLKQKTFRQEVNSVPEYDKLFMDVMKNYLESVIRTDDIIIRPSVGIGKYSFIPWICLLSSNAKISPGPQKGIYIVLLFNKDGDAFYLTLSQGITNFKNMKITSKERKTIIQNTVTYFRDAIDKELINKYNFTTEKMDLGDDLSFRGKGYIETTIISKKYEVESFDSEDFKKSLWALIQEYNEIIDHIGDKTYDDVISLIAPREEVQSFDEAVESLSKTTSKEFVKVRDIPIVPIKVRRGTEKPNRLYKISQQKKYSKIEYLDKAKEQYQTGLRGEELALEIEGKRLRALNLEPNDYIKWVSKEDDSCGYDIVSVDFVNGKLVKIFIEVKATKDIKDTSFFVSKNQVDVSKKIKDKYRILRIYDINSQYPKYYIACGEIEKNFHLDPVNYSATYKYNIVTE